MPSPELLSILGCDPESLAKVPLAVRYVVPRGALEGVPLPDLAPGRIVADERTPLMIEVIKAARAWREAGPPLIHGQPTERALLVALDLLDKAHPSDCPCIFCQGGPIT